ncbi:MAG TPA: DUF11 domain-containing protein [Acidobacteriota bacterium]|nr:DUF11 domain-containing protein [Acidobacteriota bacterium]
MTAQSPTPPTVFITGEQGGNSEGTAENPFNGAGIQLGLDLVDPDPTNYAFSGWTSTRTGNFCSMRQNRFFEAQSRAPILIHPAVESGIAQITVSVTVTEFLHEPVTVMRTFFVEPSPFGCGNPVPSSAPRNVELSIDRSHVQLGETVMLTGEAEDSGNNPLVFRFFADTNAFPISSGQLLSQQTVAGCQFGCAASLPFQAADFPSLHFLSVEVSDGESTVKSDKAALRSSVQGPPQVIPFNPDPSPQMCQCGEVFVTVDAGPTAIEVVGGLDQLLEGEASGPAVGGTVVPGSFRWRIVDGGGLMGLSLADSNFVTATLMTPDIDVDTRVELELEAVFSDCPCTDTLFVDVLANPTPEADLAIEHTDGPVTVPTEVDFNLELTVTNQGPGEAQGVILTDLLPQGAVFAGATPSQGACQEQDGQLECELGDLEADAMATVQVTLRGQQADAFENVAYVFAESFDSNILNDSSTFDTAVLSSPLVENLFFAQFGDGGGLSSQILLVNPDPDETAVALVQLRDGGGQPLQVDLNGVNINGELFVEVPPRGIRVLRTDGVGPLQTGSATVVSSLPLGGVVIFSGSFGVAGVPNSAELSQGFTAPVEIITAEGVNTGLAFQNLDELQSASITLTLTDEDGAELAVTNPGPSVAALGQLARNLPEFNWTPEIDFSNFRGLVKATSDGNIAATVIQTRPGEFATLPVIPNIAAAASLMPFVKVPAAQQAGDGSLFFAQFGDGMGLFSQIILVNREDQEAETVQVSLRNDDGDLLTVDLNQQIFGGEVSTTVPAGGMRVLQTDSDGDLSVGSVRVASDRDLAGVILFGGPQGVAGVGSSASLEDGFLAPIETSGNNGVLTVNTGLAIANLSDGQTTVTLQLLNADGQSVASADLILQAGGHRALFVNQVEWTNPIDFDSFTGSIRVTSAAAIAATVIQQRPGQFATLPVIPQP